MPLMALRQSLILRRPQSGRLEGRTALVQPDFGSQAGPRAPPRLEKGGKLLEPPFGCRPWRACPKRCWSCMHCFTPLTPTVIASGAKQSRAAERSIGRDCFVAQDAPRNDSMPLW